MKAVIDQRDPVTERVIATLLGRERDCRFRQRVALASLRYDDDMPFVETLWTHIGHHPRDLDALEALAVLAAACPGAAARCDVDGGAVARLLARQLVRLGDDDRAEGVFGYLCEYQGADRELRREWIACARRAGRADDVIEHLLIQARACEEHGEVDRAIADLRDCLLLDPSRRDLAARIRTLSGARHRDAPWRALPWGTLVLALLAVAAGLAAVRHDRVSRDRHAALAEAAPVPEPASDGSDLAALERRVAELDTLIGERLLWTGLFAARRERAELETRLEAARRHLEAVPEEFVDDGSAQRQLDLLRADTAHVRARRFVEGGDLRAAAAAYAEALAQAPEGWTPRERVVRDLAAVRERLAD